MSSHHPQEVLLAQFSLYVHKSGLKPDSFHFYLVLPCTCCREVDFTFKIAHVTPLLKVNELSNFRPVSRLNFVSKLIEKIVASQIKSHMQNSGISNNLQSAYKCGNSTGTALLYIQNDILTAQDRGELTALSLLDLSAAFDTIDHDLLLSRLTEWFGIDGVVLQWVRSYLTGRSQLVKVNGVLPTPQLLL